MSRKERPREAAELSRRERQIMDVVYRRGGATASEVHAGIPEPPSYSAVRATLGILERKGFLRHRRQGRRYLFEPTVERGEAARRAWKSLVGTYFAGAVDSAVAALLEAERDGLTDADYRRLLAIIRAARAGEQRT
jgi:BlaI family transcriptional regulator, penicillinase repressor